MKKIYNSIRYSLFIACILNCNGLNQGNHIKTYTNKDTETLSFDTSKLKDNLEENLELQEINNNYIYYKFASLLNPIYNSISTDFSKIPSFFPTSIKFLKNYIENRLLTYNSSKISFGGSMYKKILLLPLLFAKGINAGSPDFLFTYSANNPILINSLIKTSDNAFLISGESNSCKVPDLNALYLYKSITESHKKILWGKYFN